MTQLGRISFLNLSSAAAKKVLDATDYEIKIIFIRGRHNEDSIIDAESIKTVKFITDELDDYSYQLRGPFLNDTIEIDDYKDSMGRLISSINKIRNEGSYTLEL